MSFKDTKRRIKDLLDLKSGEQLTSDHLLRNSQTREAEIFQLRTEIEITISRGERGLACAYCKQPVVLRGRKYQDGGETIFYFTHMYRSDDCIVKTLHRLSTEQITCIKYNGEKESDLHFDLKSKIAHFLRSDTAVSEVSVEQIYKDVAISQQWRKPDILATWHSQKIAFELQLSTTFLSVIVGRTLFYKDRSVFLIWVFPNFSLNNDLQKFTQKDVYYNNNFNVYVLDKRAISESIKLGKLVLTCYFKQHSIAGDELNSCWSSELITLNDLTFNDQTLEVWYRDSPTEKKLLEEQLKKKIVAQVLREQAVALERKVSRAVEYLRSFGKTDLNPAGQFDDDILDDIEEEEEIEKVNNALGFAGKNARWFADHLINGTKKAFVDYVCFQSKITIDLSKVMFNRGESVFEQVVYLDSQTDFERAITLLLCSGYTLNEKDWKIFDNLHDKNYANITEYERTYIERWATIYILNSRFSRFDLKRAKEIWKVLIALLCIKSDLMIGYKFRNMRELVNHLLEHHKDFGNYFLDALKTFGRYGALLSEDKKGKIKAKIDSFAKEKPTQKGGYHFVICSVFPELSAPISSKTLF